VSDGIRLAPCLGCNNSGWVSDGLDDWIRCKDCNPPPQKAEVLEFRRGARVRKPQDPVDDLPPAA
jgi:hypothetical protein